MPATDDLRFLARLGQPANHCNIYALVGSVDRERCRMNRTRSNRPPWASDVRDNGCTHKTQYRRRSASFRVEKSRSGDKSEVIQTGSFEGSRPGRDRPTRTWLSPPVDELRFDETSIRDSINVAAPGVSLVGMHARLRMPQVGAWKGLPLLEQAGRDDHPCQSRTHRRRKAFFAVVRLQRIIRRPCHSPRPVWRRACRSRSLLTSLTSHDLNANGL